MTSELPPPETGQQPTIPEERRPRGARRADRTARRAAPNYTARRVAAASGLLAVIAVIAGGVIWFTRDDTGGSDYTAPTWSHVIEVERATGVVYVLDPEGDEVTTIDGLGRVAAVHIQRNRLALVGPGRIHLVDASGDGSVEVEVTGGWVVERLPNGRALTLIASPSTPGNLLIVDGLTGDQLDVAELAGHATPLYFTDSLRTDADGRAFAIGDGRNFQTVVVRFDHDDATFFPGVPMAVSDEVVITSQNIGSSAEVGVFDTAGERLRTATTARPVGGVLRDGRFVYVTEAGEVLAISADDDGEELAELAVPTGDEVVAVAPTLDGQRLVVTGRRFVAVVDLEGTVVFQTTFTADREFLAPGSTWRCLPVAGDDPAHALVDLSDGATLADLSGGAVAGVSADGCAVHMTVSATSTANDTADGGTDTIVSAAGVTRLPASARAVHLSPDGEAAVVVGASGVAGLITLTTPADDDTADAVDLGQRRGLIGFVDR